MGFDLGGQIEGPGQDAAGGILQQDIGQVVGGGVQVLAKLGLHARACIRMESGTYARRTQGNHHSGNAPEDGGGHAGAAAGGQARPQLLAGTLGQRPDAGTPAAVAGTLDGQSVPQGSVGRQRGERSGMDQLVERRRLRLRRPQDDDGNRLQAAVELIRRDAFKTGERPQSVGQRADVGRGHRIAQRPGIVFRGHRVEHPFLILGRQIDRQPLFGGQLALPGVQLVPGQAQGQPLLRPVAGKPGNEVGFAQLPHALPPGLDTRLRPFARPTHGGGGSGADRFIDLPARGQGQRRRQRQRSRHCRWGLSPLGHGGRGASRQGQRQDDPQARRQLMPPTS